MIAFSLATANTKQTPSIKFMSALPYKYAILYCLNLTKKVNLSKIS